MDDGLTVYGSTQNNYMMTNNNFFGKLMDTLYESKIQGKGEFQVNDKYNVKFWLKNDCGRGAFFYDIKT